MTGHDVFLVPATHPTIQSAIDAAVGPTTIVVTPGVYAESIEVIGKAYVVVQSAMLSRRGVVLEGAGHGAVVTVGSGALFLSGIEVRSRGGARGIVAVDATISLQDCIVAGNRPGGPGDEGRGAGMLCRGSNVHLQKSLVAANVIDATAATDARGGGVFMADCVAEIAGCTIQLNEIHSGGAARGGGICCERTKLRMWRSRVTDNALRGTQCEGGGLYVLEASDAQVGGCVVTGNNAGDGRGGGVFVEGRAAAVSIHRNTFVKQNNPDDVVIGA